ncbi:hypothetical protein LWC35_17740 [Pseudonocardia kujensis]|uniref:hypothetical protein n=1 Tax=Pseudonocardia kujensis TaxID=1128675 RepID=UPI001E51DCD8|nr:hypothetical protein [Pseudonocardia kujensis]MCE0764736.1 hypothetical protein [Pseudonocardia kujensis]
MIRVPSSAVAYFSTAVTSAGTGWALSAAPMIASHLTRRPSTSPTAGGVAAAIASPKGAMAAANSGS